MNIEIFIAKKIIFSKRQSKTVSRPIVRISVIGIALGIAIMIITLAIVKGFQTQIREKVVGFASGIQITSYDNNTSYEPNPINKNQPFYNTLKKHKGIKHIEIFAIKNGIIKTKIDNEGVLLTGVGSDYDWTFIKNNLVSGTVFNVSDTGVTDKIVISELLASRLELKLNEKLLVFFVTKKKTADSTVFDYEQRVKAFYISGIYKTGLEDFDKKTVFVDIGEIQKLNFWNKNQIGGFEISVDNFKDVDNITNYVNNQIGEGLNAQSTKEINSTIFSWLDLQNINAIIVITLMLLVAAINMVSALLILILERTNMIGILKAIGQKSWSIQKIFLYNATYLIGLGMFWGNVFGISLCLLQQHFGFFTLPQATYYVSVVPIQMNYFYILLLNIGTLLTCLLMLIIPSFIVSRITPIKAIRFD
ncbi:MAG TPA: FtsX-like permease family protein [Bacteroidia bacterium]|nr:FtsX-like permease family protein [Bacteroidia bacterium]